MSTRGYLYVSNFKFVKYLVSHCANRAVNFIHFSLYTMHPRDICKWVTKQH